ncbi:MAG: SixA phosphatase family protein [Planctomycetia bacterium]
MKTLLVLRHAKSGWEEPNLPDHDRTLTDRGRRDAAAVGELLLTPGMMPDLIVSSTAKRTRKTVQLATRDLPTTLPSLFHPHLYESSAADYLRVLAGYADGSAAGLFPSPARVMVVGHNPLVEDLIQTLTDRRVEMPTAGLAVVALSIGSWSEIAPNGPWRNDPKPIGRLARFWTPDEGDAKLPQPTDA